MLISPAVERKSNIGPVFAGSGNAGWIFELDDHGRVLYSKALPGTMAGSEMIDPLGFNFFDDLDGFREKAMLRERFRSFVVSGRSTESFYISAGEGAGTQKRILLTKVFRTGMPPPSPLVMMEIRKVD
jgi:hypothetical protein